MLSLHPVVHVVAKVADGLQQQGDPDEEIPHVLGHRVFIFPPISL